VRPERPQPFQRFDLLAGLHFEQVNLALAILGAAPARGEPFTVW
jgi:hypothetical protein